MLVKFQIAGFQLKEIIIRHRSLEFVWGRQTFYECKQCCIPLYMTPSSEIHYIKPDCTRLQKDPPGPEVIKLFLYSYSDEFSLLGVCTSLSMTQKTEVIKVLSWIWNTCIITYGVARDCFKKRTNLDIF